MTPVKTNQIAEQRLLSDSDIEQVSGGLLWLGLLVKKIKDVVTSNKD